MTIPGNNEEENITNFTEAELFEAISHPTRIQLLKTLFEEPKGFAELKHTLGISGNGTLQHHLQKLGNLVMNNEEGKYSLSDLGNEAIITIQKVNDFRKPFLSTNKQAEILALIGALSYYIVQLNVSIFLGNVDILTPIFVLLNSIIFGVVNWAMWKVMIQFRNQKKNNLRY
ncbi:MAG: ArsR/SmtB family transcription factor [Candidatus Ranarchaeia archaeon]